MRNTPQCLYVKFLPSFSFFKCRSEWTVLDEKNEIFLKNPSPCIHAISELRRELGRVSNLN